jgi:NAD(P)-dependent dehydrogenase (short-subunit alcohol dehydrogenase family)
MFQRTLFTVRPHRRCGAGTQKLINGSGKDPKALEKDLIDTFRINVIGQIHLFNLFLPLVLKGSVKKIIALGSGLADDSLTSKYDLEFSGPYSISKAALNTTIAKYSAELRKDGVLFLSLSPGLVETGQYKDGMLDQLHFLESN